MRDGDRQRYRDHHHQRRSPRTEKQHDHQRGQAGGDGAFVEQPLDRHLDEYRLIEQFLDLHARRRSLTGYFQRLLDTVDNGYC